MGLNLLLRYSVDACLPVRTPRDSRSPPTSSHNLASTVASLELQTAAPLDAVAEPANSKANIKILSGGTLVPQASLVEMKTRMSKNLFDSHDTFPQIYLSQTPLLFLAYHEWGTFYSHGFHEIKLGEMKSELASAQTGLRQLGVVLREIYRLVKEHGKDRQALSLIFRDGKMVLYKRKGGVELDEELRKSVF